MSPKLASMSSMLWKRQMLMRPLRCTCSHMNMRSSPSMPGLEIFRRVGDEDLIKPLPQRRTNVSATLIAVAVWPGMLPMMQL